MIKYSDAELISVLPLYIKDDADTQAISYAFKMAMAKAIQFSRLTSLYANIDGVSEEILDLMALELGTQYYDENMNLDTKRKLIKNTLAWYKKAGTPSAVTELIEIVFGEGEIVEWFDFTEPPFTPNTFDIITNATMTEEVIEYFLSIIRKVKNARSHIRSIQSVRRTDTKWHVGSAAVSIPHRHALNHHQSSIDINNQNYGAAGLALRPKTTVDNNKILEPASTSGKAHAASGYHAMQKITIINYTLGTASGSGSVLLSGAWDAPIQDMTVLGKSGQSTTKGVQLLNQADRPSITINGVSVVSNLDGSYTANGTPTANTDVYLVGGWGSSSVVFPGDISYYCTGLIDTTQMVMLALSGSVWKPTGVIKGTDVTSLGINFTAGVTYSNMTFYPMVYKTPIDASIPPFEPYTGGIPSPNPDYPQPISSMENPVIVSTDGDGLVGTVDLTGYTLRGIDNVRDMIVRRDGVWGIERNVTEYTTNGGDIKRGTTNDPEKYRWTIDVPYAKSPASYDVKLGGLCNSFQEITASNTFSRMNGFGVTITTAAGVSGRTNIYWEDWAELTLEDVKAAVAQNPITFILPRETPTWEPFPAPIQQQFNNLRTYRGDNSTVYVVSEIAPDISVTYIQDSNKVIHQLRLDMAEREIDILAAATDQQ